MYGAQTSKYDFHYTGFDEDILAEFLTLAGFCEIRRVPSFGLFEDTSELTFKGVPISLNIAATACVLGEEGTLPQVSSDNERTLV